MRQFFVYILASQKNGTLYVGVTNNLNRRVHQHRLLYGKTYTAKYGVTMLVYYESWRFVTDAIRREKQLKNWQRDWKLQLINKFNPRWRDLFCEELQEDDFKMDTGSSPV